VLLAFIVAGVTGFLLGAVVMRFLQERWIQPHDSTLRYIVVSAVRIQSTDEHLCVLLEIDDHWRLVWKERRDVIADAGMVSHIIGALAILTAPTERCDHNL
jgi:hypothetical protein